MKILVTGGAGYIGSHMVRMLASRGYKAVVLDSLEFGHRESLPRDVPLIVGNVGDARVVLDTLNDYKVEAVMHFAGYIAVEESVRDPRKYMRNNLLSPLTLLEAMKEVGVKHIIFSSTAAVYGTPVKVPIPEDHRKEPLSPYGLSKWCFEQLLAVYDRLAGIRSASLRYFNAAGASLDSRHGEAHAPETHLIPLACQTALGKRREFLLYGTDYSTPDGSAIRDFIHLEDLCEAHLLVLEALALGHKTDAYNVGIGYGASVREVVAEIKRVSGIDFPIREVGRRTGDPPELVADPSKLMKEFGWKPKGSDLETIVKTAWEWYKKHPDGYK